MTLLKRLVIAALLLFIFVYGVVFAVNNNTTVSIDLLFNSSFEISLALWSGILILIGLVAGLLASSLSSVPSQLERNRLKKSLAQAQERLAKLDIK